MMSNQVYVNGVFSGGFTNTAKFSLYVSPYLVANQGCGRKVRSRCTSWCL